MRLSLGIKELDELLQGGIPKYFLVAVTGEPGTGKTILCMHFIWAGLQNGEPGIYVTTEESKQSIINQAKQFGWDFERYINSKELIILDALHDLRDISVEDLVDAIIQAKKSIGYKDVRLVIDSMSAFWLDKPSMARRYSYYIKRALYPWHMTILATSQYAITTSDAFGFGIEHVADGIIRFRRMVKDGKLRRFMIIEKMRQTDHDKCLWEIDIIDGKGLKIIQCMCD